MAHVDFVLAVVAVGDIAAGRAWYTTPFGREPNNPMPNLVEWQVTDGGWVQVTEDPVRAGKGMLNPVHRPPGRGSGTSEARDAIQTGLDRAVETGLLAMAVTRAAQRGSLVQPGSGPRNSTTSSACAGSEPWP